MPGADIAPRMTMGWARGPSGPQRPPHVRVGLAGKSPDELPAETTHVDGDGEHDDGLRGSAECSSRS